MSLPTALFLDENFFFDEKVPFCCENNRRKCNFWTKKCTFRCFQMHFFWLKCPSLPKKVPLCYENWKNAFIFTRECPFCLFKLPFSDNALLLDEMTFFAETAFLSLERFRGFKQNREHIMSANKIRTI